MKRIVLLLVWLVTCWCTPENSIAQTAPMQFGRYFRFEFSSKDRWLKAEMPSTLLAHDTAVYQALERLNNPIDETSLGSKPVSPILLGVKLNPLLTGYFTAPIKSMSKSFMGYIISDGSAAIVIALGINKENYRDYEYRVVENDSIEVIPWSKIPRLEQKYGAKQPYGFIGNFKALGKQLFVEVKNARDYSIREGVIFDWRENYKPTVTQMLITTPQTDKNRRNFFNILSTEENRGFAKKFDPTTKLPLDLNFAEDSVTNIRVYFKEHTSIAYSIFLLKKGLLRNDTTSVPGIISENSFDIDSKYFEKSGDYDLIIQRIGSLGQWPEQQMLRIAFQVKQPPKIMDKKVSIKQLLPYMFATLTGVAIMLSTYSIYHKTKFRRVARDEQLATLKLKSIRSQLNPHFMFNALTSIQNLINKNNITDANFYLSKFAGLTRQVLDSNNENLLSLEDEVKLLTDYLEMEQLRFSFQYEVDVDPSLNQANIEVPAMLLQPFVENAVKHGVSGLKDGGMVKVHLKGIGTDLEMKVQDNGAGYAKGMASSGYGIKLSEERVELLNQLYKDQSISLAIDSSAAGTVITIRLSNWIS
jgi:two-component system LytT family sensor kinase